MEIVVPEGVDYIKSCNMNFTLRDQEIEDSGFQTIAFNFLTSRGAWCSAMSYDKADA